MYMTNANDDTEPRVTGQVRAKPIFVFDTPSAWRVAPILVRPEDLIPAVDADASPANIRSGQPSKTVGS
jgi:hypothetical protein